MDSLQHVYRRGYVFWWRRVHRLLNGSALDVRLSLRTGNRSEARNRGAALSASTERVLRMLNARVGPGAKVPTEAELQRIAKAMYEELLAELCTDQRSTPYLNHLHAATNEAYIAYFDRMMRNGGQCFFGEAEERRLVERGWDAQRIADLRKVIELAEDGHSPIKKAAIDRHLVEAGFRPDDQLRWRVELALYPAFRDAFADAQVQIEDQAELWGQDLAEVPLASEAAAQAAVPTVAVSPPAAAPAGIPHEWLACTPIKAAERMIASTPRLLDHRAQGKRAKSAVGEQTLRQIRWAATLLEKSLPPGTPLWKVTKEDIVALDRWFERLPVTFGKSPADRDPATTLADAAAAALEKVDSGDLDPSDIGLSTGTTNKHFNKLGQIHSFMCEHVKGATPIDFTKFTAPIEEDERDACTRYSVDQGRAIFNLPPWTGCMSSSDRLTSGNQVYHDSLFFLLLLVWYTGARREELCKLLLEEVEELDGIPYLLIKPSVTGRIKNKAARRVVAIADELIRLGFLRYVDTMRAAGETLLFPELIPATGTKRKLGDVFYKIWWIYIKPHVPGLRRGQAMHAARHMVADELKQQEVFIEFRNDLMGHKGQGGEGLTRYPKRTSLSRLQTLVERIPIVTDHLADQTEIRLLPAAMRVPRPRRGPPGAQ